MIAECEIPSSTPAARSYTVGTAVCMTAYVVLLLSVAFARKADALAGPALYAAAAAPALPVVAQLFVALRYMERSDEFIRAVMAKRFIVAATLTFAGLTVWGFMEEFADAPHVPGWWAYAAFWGLMGLCAPFIRSSR